MSTSYKMAAPNPTDLIEGMIVTGFPIWSLIHEPSSSNPIYILADSPFSALLSVLDLAFITDTDPDEWCVVEIGAPPTMDKRYIN